MSRQSAKHIPILMYHSISDSSNPKFKRMTVLPALFERQMAYLFAQHYTPLTVTQLMQTRTEKEQHLPERPVIITFDDGFADFFTIALPILKKYAFSATLYISTAFVNGQSRWMHRENETTRSMLTWEQIREIHASGIECGAHTHTHPQLDILSSMKSQQEIAQSKQILEDHLEREILSFAYPYGYHTTRVQRQVRQLGFRSACAVKYAMSTEHDDLFALPRLIVENMSDEAFIALLTRHKPIPDAPMPRLYTQMRRFGWRQVRRGSLAIERRVSYQ